MFSAIKTIGMQEMVLNFLKWFDNGFQKEMSIGNFAVSSWNKIFGNIIELNVFVQQQNKISRSKVIPVISQI